MIGLLRLSLRGFLAFATILIITFLMTITWSLGARRLTRAIMQTSFRINSFFWGIHVRVLGTLAPARPLLLVSNHFSYLDLFALGGIVPAAFTPKSEMRHWPLLGFMSKVSGCLFIDRRAARTLDNKRMLDEAIKAGDIISLFPEGTTSDGTGLMPFKSSFFSIAENTDIPVQPVSVAYTHLNGMPIDASALPTVGWYGDAYFFPHVTHYLKQRGVNVTIVFHPPVSARDFTSRKELALYCQRVVEKGIAEVLQPKKSP